MKSLVILLGRILEDLSIRCTVSTTRDLETIASRVADEGGSFITITLPAFGRDFERSLDLGRVDPSFFQGFRKKGPLPVFMKGLVGLVFDKETGCLLDDPSVDAIQGIRQVSNLMKKLKVPCSEERYQKAIRGYIETDQSIPESRLDRNDPLWEPFLRISWLLFGKILFDLDASIENGSIIPKHGPGSTADRTLGNAKYRYKVWTERLEEQFPAMEFLYSSPRHYLDAVEDGVGPVWLDPGSEPAARLVAVPKTLKAPRLIAIEPVHMQYVQQGLMEAVKERLEGRDNPYRTFIGFEEQETNRTMACQGSRDSSLATLDLSEASDRVSIQHVDMLTYRNDPFNRAIFACRTNRVEVPGYGPRSLAKYASMGSALTFPLEAMVFCTIVFVGIELASGIRTTAKRLREFLGSVRIYGDDIIVPREYAVTVAETLEAFGLKVNRDKSFWTGKFRESCGGDYYDGHDVTVVYCSRVFPTQRQHVQEIASAVSLRNKLYQAGYWRSAEFMDVVIRKVIPFPDVHDGSPGLGRLTYLDFEVQKVCPNLQRPLVKAATIVSPLPVSPLDGEDALLKWFLKRGEKPFAKDHLSRAGRPESSYIKLRWVPPY